jgi:hypothetical protein
MAPVKVYVGAGVNAAVTVPCADRETLVSAIALIYDFSAAKKPVRSSDGPVSFHPLTTRTSHVRFFLVFPPNP